MNCPSCGHNNSDKANFCARCRMVFTPGAAVLYRVRDHLQWILRRANAGFAAGLIAWFFIPIVSRILAESSPIFIYSLTGAMGGAFLGCVDGMVEESTPKTLRGALMGGVGGALGGFTFVYLREILDQEQVLWALFIYWGLAGAFIGAVSAFWEGQPKKLLTGILSGFVGGGIGGYLGAAVHANLVQQADPSSWLGQRFLEALIGGFIGVTLWFSIGTAERFVIFKRRFIKNQDHKNCDSCSLKNPLNSWYCSKCGHVLQESAPMGKLNLSPYMTLNRVKEVFRFLSRLATATGFIAGFVTLFIFLPGNPLFVLIALVLVAIISYTIQAILQSLSEGIEILIKR